jgi:hypothetical protein
MNQLCIRIKSQTIISHVTQNIPITLVSLIVNEDSTYIDLISVYIHNATGTK